MESVSFAAHRTSVFQVKAQVCTTMQRVLIEKPLKQKRIEQALGANMPSYTRVTHKKKNQDLGKNIPTDRTLPEMALLPE